MRKMIDPYAIDELSAPEEVSIERNIELVLKVPSSRVVKSTGMVKISERVSSDDIRRVLKAAEPISKNSAIWIQTPTEVQYVLHRNSLIKSSTPPVGLAGRMLEATVSFVSISERTMLALEHEFGGCGSPFNHWSMRIIVDEEATENDYSV